MTDACTTVWELQGWSAGCEVPWTDPRGIGIRQIHLFAGLPARTALRTSSTSPDRWAVAPPRRTGPSCTGSWSPRGSAGGPAGVAGRGNRQTAQLSPSQALPPSPVTIARGCAALHACSSAWVNTDVGWAPEMPYLSSMTKNGTPRIP